MTIILFCFIWISVGDNRFIYYICKTLNKFAYETLTKKNKTHFSAGKVLKTSAHTYS